MTVLMFHKRFVPLIRQGLKRQTIRPLRKRQITVREELSLRYWEGVAYRSPQVTILDVTCQAVFDIQVLADGFQIGEGPPIITGFRRDLFAVDDGFESWADMMAWYRSDTVRKRGKGYALPFSGNLIQWGQQ